MSGGTKVRGCHRWPPGEVGHPDCRVSYSSVEVPSRTRLSGSFIMKDVDSVVRSRLPFGCVQKPVTGSGERGRILTGP